MRTEGWISEMGRQEGGVTGEKYREEHSWVSRGRNVGRQGGSGVNGEWKALSTPHSEVPRPAFVSCPPGGLNDSGNTTDTVMDSGNGVPTST